MFRIDGRYIKQARVPVQYFIQHVQTLNLKDTDLAGAYIMYLLASIIFPDKSQSSLLLSYVQFVEGIDDDIFDISWGSVALAFMYRKLGECSRSACKQTSFCYTLLEARIYLHFPTFRPADDRGWDPQIPYSYAKIWLRTNKVVRTRNYRRELDNMQVNELIFTPYGDLDFSNPQLAQSLFHGVISFLDKIEPYMPDRVARQFGRVQQIPKPVIDPIRAWRRSKVTAYIVEYDSGKWSWNAWPMHRFNPRQLGPRTRHGLETDFQYMAWYIPRIIRTSHHPMRKLFSVLATSMVD